MKYLFTFLLFIGLVSMGGASVHLFSKSNDLDFADLLESQAADSISAVSPTDNGELKFPIKDVSNNPYISKVDPSGIDLDDPANVEYRTEYDAATNQVTIYRKVGGIDVRLPYTMSLQDYMNTDMRNSMGKYYRDKIQGEAGNGTQGGAGSGGWLNKAYKIGGAGFESVFGSNTVSIKSQGNVEINIGVKHSTTDNPTLNEDVRSNTNFDFNQKIQVNVQGSIGEQLTMGINYNTEANFDFENQMKIKYVGKEDDIIKNIEFGDVKLPLPGTLITGSQSLFGVKTELQFGKLNVLALWSQQKGQTQTLDIQGGAQETAFDVSAADYDKNRHFFLSLDFREKFEDALKTLPIPTSSISIQKIEVWVTNKSGNFDQARNICGFTDLGESQLTDKNWNPVNSDTNPSNETNTLYSTLQTATFDSARSINEISTVLQNNLPSEFRLVRSYEKIENARRLSPSEYTLNPALGFISLNTALNNDEVLAVAYQYTLGDKTYTVGELSTSGVTAPQVLFVKLLKPTNLTPNTTPWKLMMKNIYSIGAFQVNRDDFRFDVVLLSDSTGGYINYFPAGDTSKIKNDRLLKVMNLDNLNLQLQPSTAGDGVFDFVEGYTIYPSNGRVIFPVLEPFGKHLSDKIDDSAISAKFVYQTMYDSTITNTLQKGNKFRLRGKYKGSGGSDISLGAMDIPQGGVIVTAGGRKLVENSDYTVDYTLGRVKIINKGLLESGAPIQVSLESRSLFNMQTKTLMGTHLDYKFNPNLNIGATVMHLSEQPLTQKVTYGNEPISNTIWGLNGSYVNEFQSLTNFLNKAPWWNLKDVSSITIDGEFAQLVPGHNSAVGAEGRSFIDDFENSKSTIDLRNINAWTLASTPQGQSQPTMFPEGSLNNNLEFGKNRARIAWYNIDPLFYTKSSPSNIGDEQISDDRVRQVHVSEIYPNRTTTYGAPTNLAILNLAYYPNERGQYNYDSNASNIEPTTGLFTNPAARWGGIQRPIETNDFEAANIEYIEFWIMDPSFNKKGYEGGNLYFNLGSVSEDVLKDGRKSFEQGLPVPGGKGKVDATKWGEVSTDQALVAAFNNVSSARMAQDIGLDGLSSTNEAAFFKPFLDALPPALSTKLTNDPSSDDFHYFKGSDYDAANISILDRYKFFNNQEGNSRPPEFSPETYNTVATGLPDQEDINRDNTLSETESYFQYKVSLKPGDMAIGQNFITDVIVGDTIKLPNDKYSTIKWYQFKIPVDDKSRVAVNGIKDLTSVRFMRMFLKDCQDTTILRFGNLDLVRGDWRRYTDELKESRTVVNPNTTFVIEALNVEENSKRKPIPYVLPPGVDRMQDPSNPQLKLLNEQSLVLKTSDLGSKDARGAYKTMNMDMRQYKRLKMYVHAEAMGSAEVADGEMKAFIRIGSDFTSNYYEYEIPLKITKSTSTSAAEIWPESNGFNISLDILQAAKLERNNVKRGAKTKDFDVSARWLFKDPENDANSIYIVGSPNLSNVRSVMIGVRNGTELEKAVTRSVEVWMDELRLTDFDEKGGWAANARVNVKLAELGSISLAGSTSTIGFGSIEKSVTERSQQDFYQYDVASALELGKFLGPASRMSIPFYASVSQSVATPKYYPIDPDIELATVLKSANNNAERDSIKNLSQDISTLKSINFTNVRLQPKSDKVKVYDVSNLSATYSYSEASKQNVTTTYAFDRNYRGMLGYNYNARPKAYEPFVSVAALNNQVFRIIKDFNVYPYPNQFSYSWEVARNYKEEQLREIGTSTQIILPLASKDFSWNKFFDLKYSITKNLKFDFRSITNTYIYEPEGTARVTTDNTFDLWNRSKNAIESNYQHSFNFNYTLPINKLPYLDWTSSSLRYGGTYNWAAAPKLNLPVRDEVGTGILANQRPPSTDGLGNTIKNSNTIQANGQLTFSTLYKKSAYLNSIWKKYDFNPNPKTPNQAPESGKFNMNGLVLVKGTPFPINHKLGSTDVVVKVFDKSGKPMNGVVAVESPTRVTFTPESDSDGARVLVTGTVSNKSNPLQTVGDVSMLLITSLKSISASYTINSGTILPGYLESDNFMHTLSHPGLPFVAGIQDRGFATKAADNKWITGYEYFNSPYQMNKSTDFTIKAAIEPVRGLKIDLNADQRTTWSLSETYRYKDSVDIKGDNVSGVFGPSNTKTMGTYSRSFLAISSFTFASGNSVMESAAYNDFKSNRIIISHRLQKSTDPGQDSLGYSAGYGALSQDVLIPSFLAAYSGTSANSIGLKAISSGLNLVPNWRISYDGIGRIPGVNKYAKNVDISNAYKCNYAVGSYVSNTGFKDVGTKDISGNYIPENQIGSVSITEAFNPLFLVNVVWVNNITTRLEYKTGRTLLLSMSNNQLIENYTNEWVFGAGYRFDKLGLILNNTKVTNDINLRADFSIRDNISVIRKIKEDVDQLTAGMRITALSITADYVINTRFNVQAYFKRNVNTPYISLSYPTSDTMYGLSFRVSLTQ